MNIFITASRSNNSIIWMFLTRVFGTQNTTIGVAIIATIVVGFVVKVKEFPKNMKTWEKVATVIVAEILTVALALSGYWMMLYAYGVV